MAGRNSRRNSLAVVLTVLVCVVPLAQPAAAAVVRRHLVCARIYLVLTTPPLGTTNSSSVEIRNNTSVPIPAGTTYTYSIPGVTDTAVDPHALAPGAIFTIADARITSSGSCDATVPAPGFGANKGILDRAPGNLPVFKAN